MKYRIKPIGVMVPERNYVGIIAIWLFAAVALLTPLALRPEPREPEVKSWTGITQNTIMPARSKEEIARIKPVGIGEIIFCSDCLQADVCIATDTYKGSWANSIDQKECI